MKKNRAPYQKNTFLLVSLLSGALLFIITLYVAWHTSIAGSANSDGIVNTYLFEHFKLNEMVIPGNHTLLIKWPIFFIQSLLSYNFASYVGLNVLFVCITIFGWSAGIILLLGRKSTPIVLISMSIILVGSTMLPYSLTYGSLRNIEYPIGLFYLLGVKTFLNTPKLRRRDVWFTSTTTVGFILALSGDSLMSITFVAPLLIVLALCWIKGEKISMKMLVVAIVSISSVIAALVLTWVINHSGLAIPYYDEALNPRIINYPLFWPSLGYSMEQFLSLMNADLSGLQVSVHNSIYFFKFLVSACGILGIIAIIINLLRSTKRKVVSDPTNLIVTVLCVGFVTTLLAYVLFGMVYDVSTNAILTDAGKSRYIVALPLILVIGIYYFYNNVLEFHKKIIGFMVIIAFALTGIASFSSIKTETRNLDNESYRQIDRSIYIAQELNREGVQFVASGYWDGASTRFWSKDSVQFVSIADCNSVSPTFNFRKDWITMNSYSHTALLIDRLGSNANYWKCSESQLISIYGKPSKVVDLQANATGTEVWIYNYDIRTKLKPVNIPK